MTGEHTSVIYGTHYPNRLFVGCLPPDAGAEDLGTFFSAYGNVVEAKVVLDKQGMSKRFGFVTFSNVEDVEFLIEGKEVYFHGKKINVGPAVKKNMDNDNQTLHVVQKPTADNFTECSSKHIAKTVVRQSPLVQQMFNTDEDTFKSLWGISNHPGSIWGSIDDCSPFLNSSALFSDKPFSLYEQMHHSVLYSRKFTDQNSSKTSYNHIAQTPVNS